ncbi:MAG: hypothetical protein QG656_219 [Candidatus Hydrogenedentes bacterium]|nr:hypothetical protein [Candidatus Hydrogenedentota bacterium]
MNVRIIVNPVSGGGKGRAMADALRLALERRRQDVDLLVTTQPGDARMFAARPGAERTVAVGGDGTVNEVANGLAESDASLAILPMGVGNVVARQLGFPRDPEALADLVVHGATRYIDAGLCGDRRFLMGAGAGLDGAVAARVDGLRKGKKLGLASYVIPVARTVFFDTLPKTTVTTDGEILCNDAEYVVIGNCRESTGIFAATPEAEIDDGLLDVCVMRDLKFLHVVQLIWAVLRPGFAERADILYRKARTVKLSPSEGEAARLQIDGDPAGFIPATFHILPKALSVVTGGLVGAPARLDEAVCQRVASSAS